MKIINEDYKLKPIAKKDVCKPSLMNKIINHAMGSMYRMNAKTADCYAFDVDTNGKNWSGGWDWSKTLIDNPRYILMLDSKKVFEIV